MGLFRHVLSESVDVNSIDRFDSVIVMSLEESGIDQLLKYPSIEVLRIRINIFASGPRI
jgi:hypothetical protein